jgi:membrane complex biogenesis BtpA family protein
MSETLSLLRAGRKPVIGMVQLPPLAGGSGYRGGSIDDVLDVALSEAGVLSDNGVDVLMIQNLGDIPVAACASPVQVAWMTRVTAEVRQKFGRPVGLNLLENDAEAMFAIASATQADFVRIKIYVGAMMTPFGIETAQAHTAIKARNNWRAENVAIFADVHDRTGTPIASGGFEEDLEFVLRLGRADGLVLTGKSYADTLQMITAARARYAEAPILVGGGVTAENFGEVVRVADGAIVSTSMKGTGSAVGRFVPERVKAFMAAARKARAAAE